MTTPIETIYDYLNSSGILGKWTGPDGETQDGPEVQLRILEEEEVANNKRMLLVRTVSSGSGTRFVSDPIFVFAVMGKVGESPSYAEEYAELLYAELLKFTHSGCIIAIDPASGRIGGPYKTDSGRHVYDMEFSLSVDSGII